MDETAPDHWNQELADWLIGKYVLVGITYLKRDSDEVDRHIQVHGIVKSADRHSNIVLQCLGRREGRLFRLPPDTAAFSPAKKGSYNLKTTDEVVESPDVLAVWTVRKELDRSEDFE